VACSRRWPARHAPSLPGRAGHPPFSRAQTWRSGYCAQCGTPLSFAYEQPEARIYVTMGSLDDPGRVPIVRHYGIESRLPWVQFCESLPAEATGTDARAAAYLATMQNHQR